MKTEKELKELFYKYANAHIEISYCETEQTLEIDSFIELMKELKFLNLDFVNVPKGTVCEKCNGTGELPRQKGDLITRHCDC